MAFPPLDSRLTIAGVTFADVELNDETVDALADTGPSTRSLPNVMDASDSLAFIVKVEASGVFW